MPTNQIFSEEEASQILQRAVEISSNEPSQNYTPGITREELERIAGEVGVSVEALERAIREGGSTVSKSGLFNLTKTYERVVHGELDPNQFDLICEGVRLMNRHGQSGANQIGRTLKMTAWLGTGHGNVDVASRNGRTSIKIKTNAVIGGIITLYPAFVGSIIAIGTLSSHGLGWIGAAVATGLMTIGGVVFKFFTKNTQKNAERLANELKDRVQSVIDKQSVS